MPTAADLADAAAVVFVVVVVGETMSGVSSQFLPITARSYPGAGLVQAAGSRSSHISAVSASPGLGA